MLDVAWWELGLVLLALRTGRLSVGLARAFGYVGEDDVLLIIISRAVLAFLLFILLFGLPIVVICSLHVMEVDGTFGRLQGRLGFGRRFRRVRRFREGGLACRLVITENNSLGRVVKCIPCRFCRFRQ